MKRAIASVLRLTIFVAVFALLPHLDSELTAQTIITACQTFTPQQTSPCPNCCTKTGEIYDLPSPTGPGMQSLQETNYSCGTAIVGGCSVSCTGQQYQIVADAACCRASGATCTSQDACCDPSEKCINGVCAVPSGNCPQCPRQKVCVSGCSSPIIFDVAGDGFFLTSAENGVAFDISGDGAVQMGWTARGANNAFLALPGADGLVHNGKELFGNYTPQPPSEHPNGFAALAVYDNPKNGGNADGIIDSRDAIFSSLRLWIDANHDGICQPNEIHTLPSLGINSISLKYSEDDKADQYGNIFRYRARLNPDRATDAGKTSYDIFFVSLP